MKNKRGFIFNFLVIIICILYFIGIIIWPKDIIITTKKSVTIWFDSVLPALFPYFLIINILVETNILSIVSVIFTPFAKKLLGIPPIGVSTYLIGIFSGYPIGIKTVCSLYKNNKISMDEAKLLSMYVNNTSPLFIIGTCGVIMLNSYKLGIYMYLSHIIGSLVLGILLSRFFNSNLYSTSEKTIRINLELGTIIPHSVYDSSITIIMICGYITLFMNLNTIFNNLGIYNIISSIATNNTVIKSIINSILYGFFEMTNGIIAISNSQVNKIIKSIIMVLLVSWGGLSVHFQAISFLNHVNIQSKYYVIGKLLHSIIATFIYTILSFYLL